MRRAIAGLLALGAAAGLGCAGRLAPGKHRSTALSTREEVQIGQQASAKFRAESDLYTGSPQLTEYVASVGQRIVTRSDRRDLEFRFDIVDSPAVNAFGLPGGFVFVNRGTLERLNTEDELAAVLGHEIAHIAARHGAARLTRVYTSQIETAGAALFTDPKHTEQLALISSYTLTALQQGYGPENEKEADDLAAQYLERAGYNPSAAASVGRMIGELATDAPSLVAPWLASHPRDTERIENLAHEAEEMWNRWPKALERPLRREAYLTAIDGLPLGLYNEVGHVRGNVYVSRRDSLSIAIPAGWSAEIGAGDRILVATRAEERLSAELKVERKATPGPIVDAARAYAYNAANEGLELLPPLTRATVPAGDGIVVPLRGLDREGRWIELRKLFLARFDKQVVLTFIVPAGKMDTAQQTFMEMAGSIQYLAPRELSSVVEPRLAIYQSAAGDTWGSIAEKQAGAAGLAAKLAAYNGFGTDDPIAEGVLIKVPPRAHLAGRE